MSAVLRALAAFAWPFALAGCATLANNQHANVPIDAAFAEQVRQGRQDVTGEHAIAFALSGGGMRAAAFSFGAIQALTPAAGAGPDLFDDLSFLSSVSGGSLTAAYTGLFGRQVLTRFREDVLYRDLERDMRRSLWSPSNLMRLLGGGLNDRSNMAHTLDREVFRGATYADMYRQRRPEVWINASDLYNRTPFPFIPPVFSTLCSDLSKLPISEAVAASMAVPIVFAPIVIKPYPDDCASPLPDWMLDPKTRRSAPALVQAFARAARNYRDPQRMRYVKLVDGGVTDNNGLSSLLLVNLTSASPWGPFTQVEALRLKKLLFLVIDAGRPVGGEWAKAPEGPSVIDVAIATTDTATDSATRVATDAFLGLLGELRRRLVAQRCALGRDEVERSIGPAPTWRCDDLEFMVGAVGFDDLDDADADRMRQMPTRLTLPREDIDAAIAAGKAAIERHPAFQRYRTVRLQ
jgi:NTE family protein